jgi:hypothetical protein
LTGNIEEKIAQDFTKYFNTFHSYREPYDDQLDEWLHAKYAHVKKKRQFFDFRSQPYFSPSSANSCRRELYEKVRKSKRDEQAVYPWQRRWTALGTAMGDWIQREVLLAERHYEKFTGEEPRFMMDRTKDDEPFFEDFVKTMKVVEHRGHRFSLFGTSDGVLTYRADNGEVLRVGLEIKSKQTTAAQTSDYSMREPKEDHVKQVTCYAIMYDVDYYIVLYVNASKKSWMMSEEDFAKTPDFKAFGLAITDEMKTEVLDGFADVLDAVKKNEAPPVDLTKWTFNGFKTAIAESLTEEEYEEIKRKVSQVRRSSLPEWKKRGYAEALNYIDEVRSKEAI